MSEGVTTDGNLGALADRFVDLACLTYDDRESVERRQEAAALLEKEPGLVEASVLAAAAVGDTIGVAAWLDRDPGLINRATGPRGFTPLLALCYSRVQPARPGWDVLVTARVLIERGADPNAYVMLHHYRFTAMTGAIGEGERGPVQQPPHPQARALVELLLAAGGDPDEPQGLYNTHFRPSNAWLELLLAHGLRGGKPVNWDPKGPPTLDYLLGQATQQGFTDRVRLLLAGGADPGSRNYYNKRPHLENALLEGHAEVAALLEQAGAPPPALTPAESFRAACLRGNEVEASRLLAAHPETRSDPGTLTAAARNGNLAALRLALDLGLPIAGAAPDGLTPLHHAARSARLAAARELVDRGAPLDARDATYAGRPVDHASHFFAASPSPEGEATLRFLEACTPTSKG